MMDRDGSEKGRERERAGFVKMDRQNGPYEYPALWELCCSCEGIKGGCWCLFKSRRREAG